jgi:hypothetical protein
MLDIRVFFALAFARHASESEAIQIGSPNWIGSSLRSSQ